MERHPLADGIEAGGADSLLASTIYLMSRYAANPCPRLARLVDRHLAAVASHPDCGALVRETSRRAAGEWGLARVECPLGFGTAPCEGR